MILDPAFSPGHEALPENWMTECMKVLEVFFPAATDAQNLMMARQELEDIAMQKDQFGKAV